MRFAYSVITLCVASVGLLDDEASNVPKIATSSFGRCYAKSVPDSLYGQAGRTRAYWVRAGNDSLLADYRWYSQLIYIECNVAAANGQVGLSVVRIGHSPRGQVASSRDLAFAFYRGNKLLRSYSTLDIALRPNNVIPSVSHYSVLDRILGYRWVNGNRFRFEVETIDRRVMSFDPGTGALVETKSSAAGAR